MSLRVGLGASQADIDVQGEIDFDFFEESDNTNKTSAGLQSNALSSDSDRNAYSEKKNTDVDRLPESERELSEFDPNINESCSSLNFKKPMITVSCDDATGVVQKTIETVIPTPFNYKESKCGRTSPRTSSRAKRIPSPYLRNKMFLDKCDVSDDSSLSSMSESDSDLSASEDSFDLDEGTDSLTDVSPVISPFRNCSPNPDFNDPSPSSSTLVDSNLQKNGSVKFAEESHKECEKCNSLDVMELLNAVKRLEMGQNVGVMCSEATPSVITQNAKCRKNLSFSNEEVRRIDNDNRNLLKKIVAQQNRPKTRPHSVRVISSSAVNRQRHQRQIELENLALLKRLESTKSSRDLNRVHLLRDYERRSSAVLSRASSRSSKFPSRGSSCRTSAQSSGRSSAISLAKSTSHSTTIASENA
ncbi:cilia- and flagella-associated protein 97-like [Uloborus diversus]|uniref:cilia- and flagella-associated protein 97-like n=1 Tax=Uloborus diversus TaxID=327109 RepID=UPI002409E424|nr:cilia- and flagella-associated protein 97-like [Uloborus diversus]